ncbi:MAG: ribonuclease HII [Pseudomonadota bacterium]
MAGGPDFSFEEAAHARGCRRVAGVDEVGRGALCGPVVAAAVRLDPRRIPAGLNDSKLLTARQRTALNERILAVAEVALGEASVEEIDRLNVLRASQLAMCRALAALATPPDHVLIDGHLVPPQLDRSAEAVVRGDARSLSIAAASIVAKVHRDRLMVDLAQQHPGYGWERNAGYPTADHVAGLTALGATPHHRRTFAPVHNILYQEKFLTH